MSKKNKNSLFQGGPANLLLLSVIFLAGIVVLARLTDYTRQTKTLVYSDFIHQVEQGTVKEIQIVGQDVKGVLTDGTHFETAVVNNPADLELLKKHNVKIAVVNQSSSNMLWYFMPLLLCLLGMGVAAWFFIRQSRGSGNGGGNNTIFSMGKSRARLYMPSAIKETFDSVAGAVEAKEELKDVVEFLKNPDKYGRLGAKITRGVLLVGEPGNGKTLLAKAVAGEANCPFFSISGSDFIEVFVGVGASRVRDLFAQARKHAPCIVFIDEIDAVGRQRGSGLGGGHDEREQTLNQLLTEMDGFQTIGGSVIVIAATNRPDVLDKALLRPGRFDRQVTVPYPDLASREQILKLHAQSIKLDPAVDLRKLARGTPGFTGADLANLINEAALQASKVPSQHLVTLADLDEARDKVILGKKWASKIMTQEDRTITAYHEAGHTLMNVLLDKYANPLHKVTILPRGHSLGVTAFLSEEQERFTDSKERKLARIKVAMGGRAAEEVVFNTQDSGAVSDFKTATELARRMVCLFGMSEEVGPVLYAQDEGGFQYSQKTAEKIDTAVQKILEKCLHETKAALTEHREKLETLARGLLDKETLDAKEVYSMLGLQAPGESQGGMSIEGTGQFASERS